MWQGPHPASNYETPATIETFHAQDTPLITTVETPFVCELVKMKMK